ncbi:hypothetical protein SE17_24690 [Kouleothrix aurantiaca]|uniref:Uncharacterized protein n=1 Tax=Kouleothrix aurantiaca TaxID=186479 RepID=A0A0N8PRT5_9CHLR|nr:hypothetical protein SE17_24690 [Kouleothrix aurantiaca]
MNRKGRKGREAVGELKVEKLQVASAGKDKPFLTFNLQTFKPVTCKPANLQPPLTIPPGAEV